MKRKEFIQKSLLAAGGVYLASNFISCSDDDDVIVQRIVKKKEEEKQFTKKGFEHGVGSFDPTDSQVIIWTRYSVKNASKVSISWQIASDEAFKNVIRSGKADTDVSRDYTVSVEVQELEAGQKLYYRFMQLEENAISEVGETLTFPKDPSEVKMAVCSCANYPAGFFNVYNAVAKSSADVVLHLGDYIYEYGKGGYNTTKYTSSLNRHYYPEHEILSLQDYRDRYKQYRSDEDLKLAHQKKPFICVWDDHEVANDAYKDGAGNHQSDEGSYQVRKQAAIQAYSEYIPVRTKDKSKIYRTFTFGNLVNLIMLDTRLYARSEQLHYSDFTIKGTSRDAIDMVKLGAALKDPSRGCLGSEQFSWLENQLNHNASWQVIGNQILMGKMMLPEKLLIFLQGIIDKAKHGHSLKPDDVKDFVQTLAKYLLYKLVYERKFTQKLNELYSNNPNFTKSFGCYFNTPLTGKETAEVKKVVNYCERLKKKYGKKYKPDEKQSKNCILSDSIYRKISDNRSKQFPELVKALKEEKKILDKIPKPLMDYIIKYAVEKVTQLESLITPVEFYFMTGDIDFGSFACFFCSVAGQKITLDYIISEYEKWFGKGFDKEHRLVPYHLDSWDGYYAEREKVLNLFKGKGNDVVVLSGDSHNSWHNKLVTESGEEVGNEFGGTSVTSPGIGEYLNSIPVPEIKQIFGQCLELLVEDVRYVDTDKRGWMQANFTHGGCDVEYHYVDTILSKEYNIIMGPIKNLTKK